MGRQAFPLPPGFTATRVAGGRNGATRWEIWHGRRPDDGSWLTDAEAAARYLGDVVRWQPEGTWSWQPAGTYDAILAGTELPPEVDQGTLEQAAAAMTAAAKTARAA